MITKIIQVMISVPNKKKEKCSAIISNLLSYSITTTLESHSESYRHEVFQKNVREYDKQLFGTNKSMYLKNFLVLVDEKLNLINSYSSKIRRVLQ
jgi:hypothetical protein